MKLVSTLAGLAALGAVALLSAPASAMPIDVGVSTSGVAIPAGYVCNEWGHCWHRHYYRGAYYHPQHYWGGDGWHRYGGWHRHYGYRWHHWHHWRHWHRWHHWHHWNGW